jgi:hypothetical protein
MGNNILPKMKDNSVSTVPRAIVKGKPKAKNQRPKKTLPQEAAAEAVVEVAAVEENVRKLIQKTKNRFRHFVFTETSPAISPADLVGKALNVVPGVYRVGTSYVLYSHDTSCTEDCTHVRGSVGRGVHYHLMLRSAEPILETMLIKKASDAFVYIENSFYQVHVQCPLTTYYELRTAQTAALVANVGGEIFDMFERVIQRGALKPLNRVNNEPVWESHKHSQILAQEQLIDIVNAGPYRSVLSQILGALVEKAGAVSFEQHGWCLFLECGPNIYQYPSGGRCGSRYPSTQDPNEYVYTGTTLHDKSQQESTPPRPGTYSKAVETNDEVSCEYAGIPRTQPMEYDLPEDLLKEMQGAANPEEVLETVLRSLSDQVNVEEEEKKDGPLYTEISLPVTNSI